MRPGVTPGSHKLDKLPKMKGKIIMHQEKKDCIVIKVNADTKQVEAQVNSLFEKANIMATILNDMIESVLHKTRLSIDALDHVRKQADDAIASAEKLDTLVFRTRKDIERINDRIPRKRNANYRIKPGMFVAIESTASPHYGSIGIVWSVNESAGEVQLNVHNPEEAVHVPLAFLRPIIKSEKEFDNH